MTQRGEGRETIVVRRPVRESHFNGLTQKVGQCMLNGLGGGQHLHSPERGGVHVLPSPGGGVMFSKASDGGDVNNVSALFLVSNWNVHTE